MASRTGFSLRLLVAIAVAGAATVSGCGSDEPDPAPTTTSSTLEPTTTAAPGPPPGAEAAGFAELAVGDCFDTFDDPVVDDLAVARFDCALPHLFEVYDVLDYEGELGDGGYPGIAVVQDWAEQACYDRFEAFIGIRWTLSELDIQTWWPTEESWERGDDQVVCAVRSDAGDRLTGSQRATGR